MPNTALVTGASGFLGRQVLKAFERAGWEAVGTGLTRANPPAIITLDLGSADEIEKVLDEAAYRPQVVVHCAANRFPDKVEQDPDSARAVNVEASRTLARLTSARSVLLIYISTDYIFAGTKGEAPYEADSEPNPPNLYGQTKLDGEKAILSETRDTGLGVVLRVPVLYGEATEPKESAINVLLDAIWKAQEKEAKIIMDDWSLRYPTNTEDVARVCLDIATTYLNAEDKSKLPKVLQFTSEDKYTKYEVCQVLAEIMGLPLDDMVANKEGNQPGQVQRPYDTHLSTKALRDLDINVHTQDFKAWWRREVRAYRK